jgi:diguanylate cyclase (GGDEF)-like protein/PAS domain S-box-containing protein
VAEAEHDPQLLQRVLDTGPMVTAVVDPVGTITFISGAVERLFGYRPDELVGTNMLDRMDQAWAGFQTAVESIGTAMTGEGLQRPMLFRFFDRAGKSVMCEVTANNQFTDAVVGGLVVYVRTWEERHLLDKALEYLAEGRPVGEFLDLLVQIMRAEILESDGVVLTDPVRERFGRVVAKPGLPAALAAPELVEGAPWTEVLRTGEAVQPLVDDLPPELAAAARAAGYEQCWAWPVLAPRAEGEPKAVVACFVLWRDHVESFDDTCRMQLRRLGRLTRMILERDRDEARLRHAARHDPLTDLPNRASFFGALQDALDGDASGPLVGVLYVDLDGFKPVNDKLGHGAGDQVLVAVAGRLSNLVRDGDLVARLGGDEFAVLCAHVHGVEELEAVARRVVEGVRAPIAVGDHRVAVGASVGIAMASPGSCSIDVLVDAADAALYEVKATDKGTFRLTELG